MIKVTSTVNENFEVEYERAEDFIRDISDGEEVIEFLNECYENVSLPIIGKVPFGKLIYDILTNLDMTSYSDVSWDTLCDDFLMCELEDLEYELTNYGEAEYREYYLKDTDWES